MRESKVVMVPENWWIAESPEGIMKERDRISQLFHRIRRMSDIEEGRRAQVLVETHRLWHVLNRACMPHMVETCWDACPTGETDQPCRSLYDGATFE